MSTYQERFTTPTDNLRAEFQRNMDTIRARHDLSAQAQRVAIARAYKAARDGLRRAQEADAARIKRQRDYLERKLFGSNDDITGANAASRRDASDRAAKLTAPDDAASAFNRARRDGDADLMRAIAAHAAELASAAAADPKWSAIVQHYAEATPGRADAYKELTSLRDPGTGFDFSYVLPMPRELGNLGDHQVDQLAKTNLTIHGDGPEAA